MDLMDLSERGSVNIYRIPCVWCWPGGFHNSGLCWAKNDGGIWHTGMARGVTHRGSNGNMSDTHKLNYYKGFLLFFIFIALFFSSFFFRVANVMAPIPVVICS